VFASANGTALDAANVRRGFRRVATAAGLNAADWTPRELRHSFVSLLSGAGVPVRRGLRPHRDAWLRARAADQSPICGPGCPSSLSPSLSPTAAATSTTAWS